MGRMNYTDQRSNRLINFSFTETIGLSSCFNACGLHRGFPRKMSLTLHYLESRVQVNIEKMYYIEINKRSICHMHHTCEQRTVYIQHRMKMGAHQPSYYDFLKNGFFLSNTQVVFVRLCISFFFLFQNFV